MDMNIVVHGFAYLSLLICVHFPFGRAQQTFFPSSVPLFFRSPYLYSYLSTAHGTTHSHSWPRLTGAVESLGWTGLIKVDNGTTYLWSGNTGTVTGTTDTVLKYFTVTPTRTIFTIQAGPLELNITYLSPIEPDDFVKQSIPFAYLAFEARSTDGSPHHMQVYTGITGEWLSWDHTQNHTWATTTTTNGSQIHSFSYSSPQEFGELHGLASWGTPYYATRQGPGVTYRIGLTQPGPTLFVAQGFLDNSVDPQAPREIGNGGNQWTSLTFAHDLGTIENTSAPVVWTLGHTFDSVNTSAVQYQDLSGNPPQRRSLYYVTEYSDDNVLIDDFLNDFPAALERAIKLDANLTNAAASTIPGTEYSDLIALATRQALGFTSLTVGKGSDGSWNTSDVMMFWRDLGQTPPDPVNTPDGLYSSFPMYLHLNPAFGALLLEPLLRFQASPAYTVPYAAANIGASWPNMTASNSSHHQGVEQSANMIILSYAQARAAGDTSLVGRYYPLLKSWADYLVNTTLFTSSSTAFNNRQVSADGQNIANQTNLAVKGVIAIKAMAMIANLTGNTADATTYSDKSRDLYTQWKAHALAADDHHMLIAYDDEDGSNYSLGYNVFADLWLGTGVVDPVVIDGLSGQANRLLSSPVIQYGLPIDSTTTEQVQSAWNMFIAAVVNNLATRSRIISRVHDRVSLNTTDDQLYPLTWSSSSLSTITGDTTPRQGAVFAPLVLSGVAPIAPTSPTGNGTSPAGVSMSNASSHPHTAAVAGGVVGGALSSMVFVGLALCLWRRSKRTQRRLAHPSGDTSAQSMHEPEPFTMQDAYIQITSTGSPSAIPPKDLLARRHVTRLAHANSMSQEPEHISPATAPGGQHIILDPRVDELRRDLDALRMRAEPPPSYVNE